MDNGENPHHQNHVELYLDGCVGLTFRVGKLHFYMKTGNNIAVWLNNVNLLALSS
jgi:hypothetical protein